MANRVTKYSEKFYNNQRDGSIRAAQQVVSLILDMLEFDSVIDVGCGIGTWLEIFMQSGKECIGLDGAYVQCHQLRIPPDAFIPTDLTQPFNISRKFDLAICLEVAEHLPPSRADSFIKDLTRLADIIIFSAAIPYQAGTDHQNEQWQDYSVLRFQNEGFVPSLSLSSRMWNDVTIPVWYRQNIVTFIKADRQSIYPHFPVSEGPFSHVHPESYLRFADVKRDSLQRFGLLRIIHDLPRLIVQSLKGRLRRTS